VSKPSLIVGLGNPGTKYDRTRHNAGFMLIDFLSAFLNIPIKHGEKTVVWGDGDYMGNPVILLKPQLYMNKSGYAIKPFIAAHHLDVSGMMVIYDDMDLDLGRIRIRKKGRSGGHNGISSIINALGTSEFMRLKMGIGRCPEGCDTADYVLSGFSKSESRLWEDVIDMSCSAVVESITEDISTVMNKFNSKN